ncbi:protein of unknown function [Cupriavidus taiwanensis]|nr:protein of unknown function [Cupriavidus taiwanensis]
MSPVVYPGCQSPDSQGAWHPGLLIYQK